MDKDIHPGNLDYIQSKELREAASQELAAGRSVRFHVRPAVNAFYGFVETLVVDGTRAAQSSDVDPRVWWGRWDAGSETLGLGGEWWGLQGERREAPTPREPTRDAVQAPVSDSRDAGEEARARVSSYRGIEEEVRALVSRSRDLEELFMAVRRNVSLIANLSNEERRRLLPTFGNSEPPWNLEHVWSWSTSQVLVNLPGHDGPEIVGRQLWDH
ncbi:hypothetical protein HPC49_11935 [Pyxidicoccus fallax]|uniref:Uncharacterized protein n=1 Tax=Pyxidicoccus fallax TaxID=394095 RepID=A0A848LHW4_9BACT|nr:hypothetical protein [Pyxidicoccus fallax]NMO17331.1 hypothetical protein [Pyxidicoccus fallax]NPC78950.1 hypothetical protein [Pyxidicoccus fallax]